MCLEKKDSLLKLILLVIIIEIIARLYVFFCPWIFEYFYNIIISILKEEYISILLDKDITDVREEIIDTLILVYTGIIRIIIFGIICSFLKTCSLSLEYVGVKKQKIKEDLYFSLPFLLGGTVLFFLIKFCKIEFFTILYNMLKNPHLFFTLYTYFYIPVACIIGPFVEEVFFRGMLYPYIQKVLPFNYPYIFKVILATMGSTILFFVAHIHGIADISWSTIFYTFSGGILFCVLYEIRKSIWSPFFIHATGNLLLYLMT